MQSNLVKWNLDKKHRLILLNFQFHIKKKKKHVYQKLENTLQSRLTRFDYNKEK